MVRENELKTETGNDRPVSLRAYIVKVLKSGRERIV